MSRPTELGEGWIRLAYDEQGTITSEMPRDGEQVEVADKDGHVETAEFETNISESGDWDFMAVNPSTGVASLDFSLSDEVVAWRRLP